LIEIPSKVNTIGNSAFQLCGIKNVTFIPDSECFHLPTKAFYGCQSLSFFNFPCNLQSIGTEALSYTNKEEITLPNSVTLLDDYCFRGCNMLKKFTIQEGSLLQTINYGVFSQCTSFSSIECQKSEYFTTETGALYNKLKTTFYILPMNSPIQFFYFPETVKEISYGAMLNCINLEVILLPSSITTIHNSAFEGCTNLISINIPMTVKTVGEDVFKNCYKLNCNLAITNKRNFTFANSLVHISKLPSRCLYKCPSNISCKNTNSKIYICIIISILE
jgi:hypothetical protein